MTQVFVVNSGSSSVKFQLIDVETSASLLSGSVDRIGEPGHAADHIAAMELVLAELGTDHSIAAVGHRVVHGGSLFASATLITPEVEVAIEDLSALAPLHNPANLLGIRAARAVLGFVPHVAVFDTAFHQTMPAEAYTYAIDAALAEKYGVRRYGFHGTSHKYVSERAAAFLDRPLESLRTIVLHLGNGASITAIDGGKSIDTSMGLTPLQGLVMGTRSGDLDPAVLVHLHRQAGLSVDELDDLLNKRSGLLGLTGSGDMRDVQIAAANGSSSALAALAVWRHRMRHYLGAYIALLGGVDAVVFTAGVGENSALLRRRSLAGLEFLGIAIDDDANELESRAERRISPVGSAVEVLVIPTNEELEIARQTLELVSGR
jgi:acetate kinase